MDRFELTRAAQFGVLAPYRWAESDWLAAFAIKEDGLWIGMS
jgi:hypothetical protein